MNTCLLRRPYGDFRSACGGQATTSWTAPCEYWRGGPFSSWPPLLRRRSRRLPPESKSGGGTDGRVGHQEVIKMVPSCGNPRVHAQTLRRPSWVPGSLPGFESTSAHPCPRVSTREPLRLLRFAGKTLARSCGRTSEALLRRSRDGDEDPEIPATSVVCGVVDHARIVVDHASLVRRNLGQRWKGGVCGRGESNLYEPET